MEGKSFSFRTGFVFNEEDLGRCSQDASIYTLLLNPLTNDGLLTYKLSNKPDLGRLQAIAAHEAVHMVEDYHDERYAAKLTLLLGRILSRTQRLPL